MPDTITLLGSLAGLDLRAVVGQPVWVKVHYAPDGKLLGGTEPPGVILGEPGYAPTGYGSARALVTDEQGLFGGVLPWEDGGIYTVHVPGDVTRYLMMGTGAGEHPAGSTVNVRLLPGPDGVVTPPLVALDTLIDGAVEEYLTAHPPTVVTDHGALTGLSDDDHPQYLTNARGDARYVQPGSLAPVATAGTYASLTGTVPTSALPPLAINTVSVVASQAAMLALTAERGDMAIRTDTGLTYVLASDSPATLADWKEVTAAGQVTSVAGRSGAVTLAKADVGLSSVDNTSDADKPISTATGTALQGKVDKGALAFNVKDYGAEGDGTADDTTALHAARDAAGAAGRVCVPAGTYVVSGVTLNKTGQSWELAPGATIRLAANSTAQAAITATADRVKIVGGLIDGNRANQTSDVIGIFVVGSSGTVRDVEVRECRGHGIAVTAGAHSHITGCYAHDNGSNTSAVAGIYVNGSPGTRIIGNRCENNGTFFAYGGAYDGDGIKIQDGTGAGKGVMNVVMGNVCRANARRGIKAQQASTVITGNLCEGNGVAGIGVTDSTNLAASGTISGNVLPRNFRGLHLDTCSGWAITGNHITDSEDYGVLANYGTKIITFTGNIVARSKRNGAVFSGLKDGVIAGNEFLDNGQAGANRIGLVLEDDVSVGKCERVLVSGNRSENTGTNTTQNVGYAASGTGDRITMIGNVTANGITNPYYLSGALTNFRQFANVSTATDGGNGWTDFAMAAGAVIETDTVTGFKIGQDAGRKIGLWGATPVARPAALTAANGGTVATGDATTNDVVNNMRTRINELEAKLKAIGALG